MKTASEAEKEIIAIAAAQLSLRPDAIDPSDLLSGHLADSLDMVEICMAIEERFDHEIDDEDADRFHCVDNVIRYLQREGVVS